MAQGLKTLSLMTMTLIVTIGLGLSGCGSYEQCHEQGDCACGKCVDGNCVPIQEICNDEIDNDCDSATDEGCDDPCDGVMCDQPPDNECVGSETLRVYHRQGTCMQDNGKCTYGFDDIECQKGCDDVALSCKECENRCFPSGITECTGGKIRECTADAGGCLDWSDYTDCPGGFCINATTCGTCENTCSTAGATECTDGKIRSCIADSNGCLSWGAYNNCPDGFCADAASCGNCDNQCPSLGTTECTNGRIRSCTADSNGCLYWSDYSDCNDGFCKDPTSCGNCDNRCSPSGSTECANGQIRICVADANGCLDWSGYTDCPEGFCANSTSCGTCDNKCLVADDTECANGQIRTCVADANGCLDWSGYSNCPSGFCADGTSCGTCDNKCPAENDTECANGQIRTCLADANGCLDWSGYTDCPEGFCADSTSCGLCALELLSSVIVNDESNGWYRPVVHGSGPYAFAWEGGQSGVPQRKVYARMVAEDGTMLTDAMHLGDAYPKSLRSIGWDGTDFAVAIDAPGCEKSKLLRFDALTADLLGSTTLGDYVCCVEPFVTWAGNEWGVATVTSLALVSQNGTLLKPGSDGTPKLTQVVWTGVDYGLVYIEDPQLTNAVLYFMKLDSAGSQTTTPLFLDSVSCCGSLSEPAIVWTGSEFVVVWLDSDEKLWRARITWEGDVIETTRLQSYEQSGRLSLAWNQDRGELGIIYPHWDGNVWTTTFGRMTLTSGIYDSTPLGSGDGTIIASGGDYVIAYVDNPGGHAWFYRYGCP
jgi:hypothetical protein